MYDRDGSLISEIVSNDENRVFVKYDNIPEPVKELFLRSEDRNFYDHKGIDFMGVVRAVAANVKTMASAKERVRSHSSCPATYI